MPFDDTGLHGRLDDLRILKHARDGISRNWCRDAFFMDDARCLIGWLADATGELPTLERQIEDYYENQNAGLDIDAQIRLIPEAARIAATYLIPFVPAGYRKTEDYDHCLYVCFEFNDAMETNLDDVLTVVDTAIDHLVLKEHHSMA